MNTEAERIRAFIAIELTPELKQALARIQSRLKSKSRAPAKWVDPESIHLTLKFLGNIDADMVAKINKVMEESARGIPPFSLEIKGLGVFPGQRQVRVVWVGLAGDLEKLNQLQQRIETGLVPLGFAAESRAFSPHLTLARVREEAAPLERQELGQLIGNTSFESAGTLYVDAVHLVRSQLTRQGAIYSLLSTVELK